MHDVIDRSGHLLAVLSWLGQFDGRAVIPFRLDLAVVVAFSLGIYELAVRSALPSDWLRRLIDAETPDPVAPRASSCRGPSRCRQPSVRFTELSSARRIHCDRREHQAWSRAWMSAGVRRVWVAGLGGGAGHRSTPGRLTQGSEVSVHAR